MNISTVRISLAHNNQIVVAFDGIDVEMEVRNSNNTLIVDDIKIECDVLTRTQCEIVNPGEL